MKMVRTSLFFMVPWGILALCGAALADVVGIEITGPGEVAENFSASYKAIAYYDDDTTVDVTGLASWSVEPGAIASIEAGVLATKDIIRDEPVTIWASYSEGDVAFEAEKEVYVFGICPMGTALSFDGVDDYVEVADDDSLDIADEITISSWVKPSDDTGDEFILAKWEGKVVDCSYGVRLADANPRFFLARNGGKAAKTFTDIAIDAKAWNQVVVTWDGTIMRAYLNGTPSTEVGLFDGPINSTGESVAIGYNAGYGGIGGAYYRGLIDEVAIYNRALSGEEIWTNMHIRLAGDEPGLVGYWDFDAGMGQIVYDLSGNGNVGYLGGDPCAVEESDPVWIESDAPIGLCTPYLIATTAAQKALKYKRVSLEALEAALAQEWIIYEALELWLEEGDFGDLSKGDIVKAGQKAHSAIQHEEQTIDMLGKGFEKLLDSLNSLGYESQEPLPPPP